MPKSRKLLWVVLLIASVLVLSVQGLMSAAHYDRAVPEVQAMLKEQTDWLRAERDVGAFARDLNADAIAMLGEATNLYLVTRTDSSKYFVFKSDARLPALESWVSRGGKLFVLNQAVNPAPDGTSRVAQQLLRVLMQPLCLLGLTLYALSSVLWFRALSIVDVSVGYPVLVSLTFLLVTSGSLLFFGESFSWQKMAGLAIIIGGIQMVARA